MLTCVRSWFSKRDQTGGGVKYSLCAKHTTLGRKQPSFCLIHPFFFFSIRWWIVSPVQARIAQAASAGKGGCRLGRWLIAANFHWVIMGRRPEDSPSLLKWLGMRWSAALSKYGGRKAMHHMWRRANEGWRMNRTATFLSRASAAQLASSEPGGSGNLRKAFQPWDSKYRECKSRQHTELLFFPLEFKFCR